jgi:methylmalonyl-CoA mutase N-terminal domain/subunit
MYLAVEQGEVQRMLGESAMAFQRRVDSGEQMIVGVNAYAAEQEMDIPVKPLPRPPRSDIDRYLDRLDTYRRCRDNAETRRVLDGLAAAASTTGPNLFEAVIDATRGGATQGEIIAVLRDTLGFGQPLIVP